MLVEVEVEKKKKAAVAEESMHQKCLFFLSLLLFSFSPMPGCLRHITRSGWCTAILRSESRERLVKKKRNERAKKRKEKK